MKKNLNIIQIKGIRGLILAIFCVCCLAVGFIAFPGWLGMKMWNALAEYCFSIPTIGLFQGILLWGIVTVTYFIFRKEKLVVCVKSPQGLSEEELKTVFSDIKKQMNEDPILQAMLKAREAELKYKAQQELDKKEEESVNSDTTKV